MTTALDSSVLWAIIKREAGHERWLETLITAASEGPLIISPVAFAELAPSTANETELLEFLTRLAITYEPISPAAAHCAGLAFKRYRKAGGPRQHLVPDFLIAAHAHTHAHRLAAIDRGYLRPWFPDLEILTPVAARYVRKSRRQARSRIQRGRNQGSATPRSRQIFRARKRLISVWRGTAERRPLAGLPHHE